MRGVHVGGSAEQAARASVLVRAGDAAVLVDSGPDLRAQALREGLRAIDAVIYTHAHLDHVAGFDELRAFCWRKNGPLPMHATEECMQTLKRMFGWAFSEENVYQGYVKPDPRIIESPFSYGDLKITPLPVEHAAVETVGFLFEYPGARSVAYIARREAHPGGDHGALSTGWTCWWWMRSGRCRIPRIFHWVRRWKRSAGWKRGRPG